MNNDLISRKDLKDHISELMLVYGGTEINMAILNAIDNALTVKPCYQTTSCLDCTMYDKEKHNCPRFCEVIRELVKEEEKRPTCEWIPVGERLPEDMRKVLVWFEYYRYGDYNCMYQTYGFGYVCDGEWSHFINGETGWQDARIIAWMPLPEPYKEEENETN